MRISDWSSDVCSSDLVADIGDVDDMGERPPSHVPGLPRQHAAERVGEDIGAQIADMRVIVDGRPARIDTNVGGIDRGEPIDAAGEAVIEVKRRAGHRAEEKTYEIQSLMRIP